MPTPEQIDELAAAFHEQGHTAVLVGHLGIKHLYQAATVLGVDRPTFTLYNPIAGRQSVYLRPVSRDGITFHVDWQAGNNNTVEVSGSTSRSFGSHSAFLIGEEVSFLDLNLHTSTPLYTAVTFRERLLTDQTPDALVALPRGRASAFAAGMQAIARGL